MASSSSPSLTSTSVQEQFEHERIEKQKRDQLEHERIEKQKREQLEHKRQQKISNLTEEIKSKSETKENEISQLKESCVTGYRRNKYKRLFKG